MIALRPVLDATENAHGRVRQHVVVKLDCIQILDRDPSEDGTCLLHVGHTAGGQLPHQVGECFLVLLGHLFRVILG